MALGLLRRLLGRDKDPYWDDFISRAPADPKNIVTPALITARGGVLHPVKTDIHDPQAMSGHLKQLCEYFGAHWTGITKTDPTLVSIPEGHDTFDTPTTAENLVERLPFTIACGVTWDIDLEKNKGIGGQYGFEKVSIVSFNLRSYLRELGYDALYGAGSPGAVATAAGLGRVENDGRFVPKSGRPRVILGELVVLTNIPLVPDNVGATA